jgi:RNA polymerase sigma-70 factor (ECF subfamily)
MSGALHSHPEHLLQSAQTGDGDALGQLLESYRPYLMLLGRMEIGRRLQGKLDPADLVQESFLEAQRDFAQFHGTTEKELIAWLRQILVRNLRNLLRHYLGTKRRDVRLERELAAEVDGSSQMLGQIPISPISSPSQQAARREQEVLLANALEQLPEHYRDVIVLRNLQSLSFPDIAQQLGRTVDSVEKLWARALLRLRRLMEESHECK